MGIRVAVDLPAGSAATDALAGVRAAVEADPELTVLLVGDHADLAHPRLTRVPASGSVHDDEEPAQAVRARREAGIRVATRLLRDGSADALVSTGPVAATTAAAEFVLGRLPGITRPGLAVALPTATQPVVLVDAGADPAASVTGADLLVQHALLGVAAARTGGSAQPRVGLLSVGSQPWAGDRLRREAHELLVDAQPRYVGAVTVADVLSGRCDVVVTDGFTGATTLAALGAAAPERFGVLSGLVVGVPAVVVAAAAATAHPVETAVETAIAAAARGFRAGLVEQMRMTGAQIVDRRRELAGLR